MVGVRVYSCYFSPNDPSEVFETHIPFLEGSFSQAVGRTLVGGDFNSKSPEYGGAALRRGTKKSQLQCWKDLIGKVERDPWNLAFKIVNKRLVTRRKTPGLDDPDRTKYIVRSLFSHVEPFQRQGRTSGVVRRGKLFTLEELARAGGRLNANTAPGIDAVINEILGEVIAAYPEILLEAFYSCLRKGRFFIDWKKQK